MAGLQYYFFPTDFFYPRPPSAAKETVSSTVQRIQPQKGDAEDRDMEQHKAMMVRYKLDQSNLPQLSASTAIVPSPCIIKSEIDSQETESLNTKLFFGLTSYPV
ncbi:hypothetical protein NC652_015639 [Populus alba x Populus x berolinensis]|nr:hypothetical protein NC652_015639 [Populus alba x Populus x berolinensis]